MSGNGGEGGKAPTSGNQSLRQATRANRPVDGAGVSAALSNRDDYGTVIYDGTRHVGTVFDLGCRHAASLADGADLGTFPNAEAARGAIMAARPRG